MNLSQRDPQMLFSPALKQDPDSFVWAYFKSFEWGYERNKITEEPASKITQAAEKKQTKDQIERLSGIIDTDDPRFDKQKEENFSMWEQNVSQLCEKMNTSVEAFYDRINFVYDQIQQTCVDRREQNIPEVDDSEINEQLIDLAHKPWVFQNLPGTKSFKSTESLLALNTKLAEMQPLELWGEPIEILDGGPQFFQRVKEFLLTKNLTFDDEMTNMHAQAIAALFGVAALSGNSDLLLNALETLSQYSQLHKEQADRAYSQVESQLAAYLSKIAQHLSEAKYEHSLNPSNVSRVFGIASMFPMIGLNERNCSLTSDGTYLYLAIGVVKRATLFKIGTGEADTIPGKVYVSAPLEREGEITWVYCQEKLYLRYQVGELGALHVFDPLTLQKVDEAKLFLADLPGLKLNENLNKNYPLLVDPTDGTLCIVVSEVEKRIRKVQACHESLFQELAVIKAENMKDHEKQLELDELDKKLPKVEQLKRQKEKMRRKGDPGAPPVEERAGPPIEYSTYQVLAFKLHKFDVSGKHKITSAQDDSTGGGEREQPESELLKEPLVMEMYQTFSGFFKVPDCARALKYNKNQIEQAANWLVAEKEKPNSKVFKRISTTLLCESQLVGQMDPIKLDLQVKPGSLLNSQAVTTGRWTMNRNQITYHLNGGPDQSSVLIFSTDPADLRILEQQSVSAEVFFRNFDMGFGMPPGLPPKYFLVDEKWTLLSPKQLMTKYEDSKKQGEPLPEFQTEESLFETVQLRGTHVKSLNKMPKMDQNYNNYITYCSNSNRFYAFNLGHQQRIISSALDLRLMEPSEQFIYQQAATLSSFISEALRLSIHANKYRFRLPWRWNQWQYLYQSVINHQSRPHQMLGGPLFGGAQLGDPFEQPEQDKTALKRLKKRFASTNEHFIKQQLQRVGIDNNLTADQITQFNQRLEKKQKQNKKEAEQKQEQILDTAKLVEPRILNRAGIEMRYGTGGGSKTLYCGRRLGREMIPGSDGQCGPNNGPQCPDCMATSPPYKVPPPSSYQGLTASLKGFSQSQRLPMIQQRQEEQSLPVEQICVPVELAKQYAWCITGNTTALQTLLSLEIIAEPSWRIQVMELILQWVTHASWLPAQRPCALNELYELCIAALKRPRDSVTKICERILIVGWQYFATCAERQVAILISLLQNSEIDTKQTTKLTTGLLLDVSQETSAAQLLRARFCNQASFYDLEILNLRSVQNYFFIFKGIPSVAKEKNTTNSQMAFKYLAKPRFFKTESLQRINGQISSSGLSLKEVPLQYIELKRLNSRQLAQHDFNMNFGLNTHTSIGLNPSYFNVPIACCFSKEISFHWEQDSKNFDVEQLTVVYTDDAPSDSSHESKVAHYWKVKSRFLSNQAALMHLCKQRLAQGCNSTALVFAHFVGQALDWIDFTIPSLTSLIADVIDIVVQSPSHALLNQVLLTVNRGFETVSGAIIAQNCLPKLLGLISNMSAKPLRMDESVIEGVDDSQEKIFETSHPYPKTDGRITKTVKITGAIGYTIQFDKRCQVESANDVLRVTSCDYNFSIANQVGTEFRFDRAPPAGLTYVVYGKQMEIEFKSYNPRGRGPSRGQRAPSRGGAANLQQRDENYRRWGYRLTVKPIYGIPKLTEGCPTHSLLLNSLVQTAVRMTRELTDASFIKGDREGELMSSDAKQAISNTLQWHLFKGGLKIAELENQSDLETLLQQGIQLISRDQEQILEKALSSISTPDKSVVKKDEELKENNLKQGMSKFQSVSQAWSPEAKQLLESAKLTEVVKCVRVQVPYPPMIKSLMMKRTFSQHWEQWAQVEKLLVVTMLYHSGSLLDAYKYLELSKEQLVSAPTQNEREDETSYLIEEFLIIGKHINSVLNWMIARLQGQGDFQILLDDTLQAAQGIISERLAVKRKQEEEAARQKHEQEQMELAEKEARELLAAQQASTTEAKDTLAATAKHAVVTKIKQKSSNKKRTNIVKLTDSITKVPPKQPSKPKQAQKEEQKTEELPTKAQDSPVSPPPKYLELSVQDLQELRSKILSTCYQLFIDTYQIDGDLSKLMKLCMFFNIDLNANDVSETLSALFKLVKARIRPLLDVDTESNSQIPCIVDVKDLNLGSPAEEVAQDVNNRLLLLLEIKPSFNYLSEVTRLSQKKPKMSIIAEQDEDIISQLSGQHAFKEQPDSDLDDDMLDDLPPILSARSMSLPTTIQSGIAKLGAVMTQPVARTRTRKQSAEYAMFIDSYRKWRLWSKRTQDEEEDLLSPNGSPLHSVVCFAKMSTISDAHQIRIKMREHVFRAAFRLSGLQLQEKLLALLHDQSPFLRYFWGIKGYSLRKSVLNEIETCGESITRQLNAITRIIVQQLMSHFVLQIKFLSQRQIQSRLSKSSKKNTDSGMGSAQVQAANSDSKRMLLVLNDIRVLLSNIYTKEYVLESLRADKHISTRNTLGIDQIKVFLKAVVSILVKTQNLLSSLPIAQVSKLVLRLFTRQSDTIKTETQRILQEMLLDTVVSQLEAAKNEERIVSTKDKANSTHLSFQQHQITSILKMLSEVLRISLAKGESESILQAGSPKVAVCVKLLTQLITGSSETPSVVRQAIRCARLLIKITGSQSDSALFQADVLKSIGRKIKYYERNESQLIEESPKNESEDLKEKDAGYCCFVHLNNPTEEDYTFLVTALYHWEQKYPIYSAKLSTKLSDVVKVVQAPKTSEPVILPPIYPVPPSQPKPKLEEVLSENIMAIVGEPVPSQPQPPLEEAKGEEKDQDKDWHTDSASSDNESKPVPEMLNDLAAKINAPDEGMGDVISSQIVIEQNRIVQQMQMMMDQIGSGLDAEDIKRKDQELMYLQMKHKELEKMINEVQGNENAGIEAQIQRIYAGSKYKAAVLQKQSSKPAAQPRDNKPPVIPVSMLKIQYVLHAIEEQKKNFQPALSTDSQDVQEKKLKERNYQLLSSLILQEAVSIAALLFYRFSAPISRTLTKEQALELTQLLKKAYAGKLEPIKMNPYSSEADGNKLFTALKVPFKDMFPVTPQKIQELGAKEKQALQSLLEKIQVAPKRFSVSVVHRSVALQLEKEILTKLVEMKACHKAQRMGPIIHSRTKKIHFGHSVSNIISELVLFVRSLSAQSLNRTLSDCLKQYIDNGVQADLLLGIVAALGGWNSQIATGTPVEININAQWYRGIVVEPGHGKRNMMVILDDESFTVHNVPQKHVRPYVEPLNVSPDETLLLKAVIKAKDDKFLLNLLLRACAQLSFDISREHPDFEAFVQILVQTSRQNNLIEEDKSKALQELSLQLSWERLVDSSEARNQIFTTGCELESDQSAEITKNSHLGQGIQNNQYLQPLNSYLQGLPEVVTQSNKSESRLKLLHYWEKHIIPSILAFCQGTYKQWEFEYYFEQLRFYLRQGDAASAISDAMKMLENKLPNGLVIPDENQDWSAKIIEEVIVGNWLLAKIKQRGSSDSSQFVIVLQRLQALGIEEILVQVKCVDASTNTVYAEYVDYDTMQAHLIWIPITNLISLQKPLPCSPVQDARRLKDQFDRNLNKVAALYSRQTLQKFVQKTGRMITDELKFEEVIGWSVWETFNDDALTGWMRDIPSLIELSKAQQVTSTKSQSLTQILNQSIEKVAHENMLQRQAKSQTNTKEGSTLAVLTEMLTVDDRLKSATDWCATLWFGMAESVNQNRCVLDLIAAHEQYTKQSTQSNNLLPLHELLLNKGQHSFGTLLMFKKNAVSLSPCSKIQFFADAEMVNLIHEIYAGNDVTNELPPVVLNHSKVWVYHHAGTNALLFKDDQKMLQGGKSTLETAIVSIPKEWQIACWLTETLTTISLQKDNADSKQLLKQLISAILAFYEDSKAPNMLKSVVLKLLLRLIIKLRYLNRNCEPYGSDTHFERTGITKEFLNGLLSEIMIQMETSQTLHGAFVQDAVEFLMGFVIPFGDKSSALKCHDELLDKIQVPDWLTPSLRLSLYIHFFRGDLKQLPADMITVKQADDFREQVIVVPLNGMPADFTHEWLIEQTKQLLLKHQAQVLRPQSDLMIYKEHLFIILDGWHPLKPMEVTTTEDSDIEEQVELKPVKKEFEIPKLALYSCPICTFENEIGNSRCGMCDQARPPMEQLQEEWRKLHTPVEEIKTDQVKKEEVPLQVLRVKSLVADLKTMVSKVQKQRLLQTTQTKPHANSVPLEEEKKEETDLDKSWETDEENGGDKQVDLSNLPSDDRARFELLGIDASILEMGDRELIQVLEQSAIEEIRAKQQKKEAEKAALKAERIAEVKRKEKERQKQLVEQGAAPMFKFDIVSGKDAFNHQVIGQHLQELLRQRVCDIKNDSITFNKRTIDVISKIHSNWQQTTSPQPLPSDELIQDLEITADSIKSEDLDCLREKLLNLVLADVTLFIKLLNSQGYDIWLTESHFVVKPSKAQMDLIRNVWLLEKLKNLVEQDICQESKLVENLESTNLRVLSLLGAEFKDAIGYHDEAQFADLYPELCEQVSQAEARYMWQMLKNFNQCYAPVVPFINQSEQASAHSNDTQILPMSMAAYISGTRELCFNCVKTDLKHLILERTTQPREQPAKIYFERLRLADQSGLDKQDGSGQNKENRGSERVEQQFMFSMAHDQVKEMDLGLLRPKKPLGAEPHIAFEIIFKNEHVVGEGGPYRQFFADISKELQPSKLERGTQQQLLDLLAPCANQRESEKVGKDKFVISSASCKQKHLSQYEFLGVLMGVCIRTGANLILDLPQFFWKQMLGQKVTLDDFFEIESKMTRNLKELLRMSELEFCENQRYWTTTLSDGTSFELRPDGAQLRLEYGDVAEYVAQTLETRLKEAQFQYDAIKRGICKIIPSSLLNIVTSKELETWVCGKNTVDIDLLMRHTSYSGAYSAEHPVITMFWKMLRECREEEKQKFIKFCWGQERIPANDQSFTTQNVRFMIKQAQNKANVAQDMLLPKADTCFFNFELPSYSCIEVMRTKIIQAITFDCVSMNAEENQVGNNNFGERGDPRQQLMEEESY